MPGGAPLKRSSKRPCKYGPRDSDGLCPKKPKSSSSSSKSTSSRSSKKPCKYGERVNGLCPKKPKAAKAGPTVKKLTSVTAASRQAGEVLRSDKATGAQKKEAVRVLTTAVAGEVTRKVGEQVVETAKKKVTSRSGKAAIKKAVKTAAPIAGVAVKSAGAAGAILYVGGKALTANRAREAKSYAKQQLALTEKRLGKQKLTAEQKKTLLAQYEAHALKKAPTNSYSGK